jgi:hypothetical protein
MRLYHGNQVRKALEHASAGGQALLIMPWNRDEGPKPFRKAEMIGKLIDLNRERLVATARGLGVRVIKICRKGKPGQHIDLCGTPLDRAINEAQVKPHA